MFRLDQRDLPVRHFIKPVVIPHDSLARLYDGRGNHMDEDEDARSHLTIPPGLQERTIHSAWTRFLSQYSVRVSQFLSLRQPDFLLDIKNIGIENRRVMRWSLTIKFPGFCGRFRGNRAMQFRSCLLSHFDNPGPRIGAAIVIRAVCANPHEA